MFGLQVPSQRRKSHGARSRRDDVCYKVRSTTWSLQYIHRPFPIHYHAPHPKCPSTLCRATSNPLPPNRTTKPPQSRILPLHSHTKRRARLLLRTRNPITRRRGPTPKQTSLEPTTRAATLTGRVRTGRASCTRTARQPVSLCSVRTLSDRNSQGINPFGLGRRRGPVVCSA